MKNLRHRLDYERKGSNREGMFEETGLIFLKGGCLENFEGSREKSEKA